MSDTFLCYFNILTMIKDLAYYLTTTSQSIVCCERRVKKMKKQKMMPTILQKIEDLRKMNIDGKDLIIEEENIDGRNIEVWFIKSEDEEVRRPTHSAMFFLMGMSLERMENV